MTATDTVTLSRSEYQALLDRIEDAEDNPFLDAVEARERALGKAVARADYLPGGLVVRMIAGEHPVLVWREHRGLDPDALAAAAAIPPEQLFAIETGRDPGSFEVMIKIAAVLGISLDDIATGIALGR